MQSAGNWKALHVNLSQGKIKLSGYLQKWRLKHGKTETALMAFHLNYREAKGEPKFVTNSNSLPFFPAQKYLSVKVNRTQKVNNTFQKSRDTAENKQRMSLC